MQRASENMVGRHAQLKGPYNHEFERTARRLRPSSCWFNTLAPCGIVAVPPLNSTLSGLEPSFSERRCVNSGRMSLGSSPRRSGFVMDWLQPFFTVPDGLREVRVSLAKLALSRGSLWITRTSQWVFRSSLGNLPSLALFLLQFRESSSAPLSPGVALGIGSDGCWGE